MSNFIPIKIPKLSKITKREMDEIKRTDDRTRGSNSTQNETHSVCDERLAREGGKATCCYCDPHEGCTLGMKPYPGKFIPVDQVPEARKMIDRVSQEDWEKRFDEKYHYQDGVELLLKSPNHFQTYDVTVGIKSFIRKERADTRKEVIEKVKQWAIKNLGGANFEEIDGLNELLDLLATLREEEQVVEKNV